MPSKVFLLLPLKDLAKSNTWHDFKWDSNTIKSFNCMVGFLKENVGTIGANFCTDVIHLLILFLRPTSNSKHFVNTVTRYGLLLVERWPVKDVFIFNFLPNLFHNKIRSSFDKYFSVCDNCKGVNRRQIRNRNSKVKCCIVLGGKASKCNAICLQHNSTKRSATGEEKRKECR